MSSSTLCTLRTRSTRTWSPFAYTECIWMRKFHIPLRILCYPWLLYCFDIIYWLSKQNQFLNVHRFQFKDINLCIWMDEWKYFEPDQATTYSINTFDDGNQRFQQYSNSWFLYGKWRGKVALVNAKNPSVRIESISEWKTLIKDVSLYQVNGSGKYSSNSPA